MSTSDGPSSRYHHGDLRAALLVAATELLESDESFSLRAVARRAGVSATAPYRHFADREALESALAVEGFRDLGAALTEGRELPSTPDDVVQLGIIYVTFALERTPVFRLMFGQECDDENDARVQAAGELHTFIQAASEMVFPKADPVALSLAAWSIVHGLAFLHLDGKLTPATPDAVADRVRDAFEAIFTLSR